MNVTNNKLQQLKKKIDADHTVKIAIFGLGSVGNYLLTYLLETADEHMEILVVGRNAQKLQQDVNIATVAASIRGHLASKVSVRVVDFDDLEAIETLFRDEQPDFVVNSSRAYAGIKYGGISWHNIRAYGIWSPLSIRVVKNIMEAHERAGSSAIVINTSYSDSVNAWLKSAGKHFPDFGSGNLNHLVPRIKFAVRDMLSLGHEDKVDVVIATSHFHDVVISKEGQTEGADPLLHIAVNGKAVQVDTVEIYRRCAIAMPTDQKRNMMNASSNFEIIDKILTALRRNRHEYFHSPGVFGNIGGFPVVIDGAKATIGYDERYFGYDDMAKHNRASIYLDGIEDVVDGTLVYTDELCKKTRDIFGVELPKSVPYHKISETAELLIDRVIRPNL